MAELSLDVVDTVRQLVRIPSVNPMGRAMAGDIYFEARITDHLDRLFRQLRLPVERHLVEPQRENILTAIGDLQSPQAPLVLWEVHQDTVPIDQMTVEPFGASVENGRIYGRGSCDIKGGMGCMITAVSRLMRLRLPIKLVLACTVNEEHGFTGAQSLTELYRSGQSRLLHRRPDAVMVAEPTELNVVIAHKGTVRWCLETLGKAGHSSQPRHAENAIYHMGHVLTCLEEYATNVVPSLGAHPLLGTPTISVGTITGGLSVNTVAPTARIEIDRRLVPGESPDGAKQHVIDYLNQNCVRAGQIKHHASMICAEPLCDTSNHELADRVCQTAAKLNIACQSVGVPYGTDAATLADQSIPTVVFGPGSIDQAHSMDEWVEIDQLHKAVEVLYSIAANWS